MVPAPVHRKNLSETILDTSPSSLEQIVSSLIINVCMSIYLYGSVPIYIYIVYCIHVNIYVYIYTYIDCKYVVLFTCKYILHACKQYYSSKPLVYSDYLPRSTHFSPRYASCLCLRQRILRTKKVNCLPLMAAI